MIKILLVLTGGALGSLGRYLISGCLLGKYANIFPYGTLTVNIIGCFCIGFLMVIINKHLPQAPVMSEYMRVLLITGFMGGFTTFSAYSYETFQLFTSGNTLGALFNITSNLLIGLLATWSGFMLAKSVC